MYAIDSLVVDMQREIMKNMDDVHLKVKMKSKSAGKFRSEVHAKWC